MSARTRPRFLTVLVTVGLIAGLVVSAPAPTRALAEPAPDPGLRAQLMSSGLGVDVEGWNWAWDESSGVELELYAPDGSGPIATAEGFPSPLEHGHHFWAVFDTTFGPNHRIVATGLDSGITREVTVRDIRISHTDRLAGTVTGTAASADPVTVIANNADASGDWLSRLATPTDADLDGVFEWAVDFTTAAGIGESGDPLVPPIDVLTGDAQLGSTGAKFSTPRIRVHTSGQGWSANVDWLDHLDHNVYLAFDNGAQHFATDAVSPWINELGNASENFDLNSIDGLMDTFGNGAGWTVSVVADADDAVLAQVELPLLTLDSVNTTTGEIIGQADDGFEVNTGGVDSYDSTWFDGTSSPWSWIPANGVAERNITAIWDPVSGTGHDYHVGYAWPSFTYTLNYDEGADGFHHFLSSLGGAPLGVRGEFPDGSVTITVDDPADTYDDTFHVDTYVPPGDYATGFEVDLQSQDIPPDAVGPGWTFTAAVDIGGVPMSKTLIIDEVSVTTVDIQNGIASGTCTFEEQEWIVQVEHDGWGENLYPQCRLDDTWTVNFDNSQPVSHVQASYQDGDLDVNTAGFYPVVETGEDPRIAAIVRSGTVQFQGDWSGEPMSITIDGVDQGDFSYDDCAQGCDWLPVNAGSLIVVSDGTTTKELTVTNLSLLGVDPVASIIEGTSSAGRDVEVWNWGDTLTIPDDGTGTWTADFSLTNPFNGDASGAASQTDDEGDQTWLFWSTPRMHVEPNGVVAGQGGWYEGDTVVVETFNPGDDYLTDDYLNRFEVTAGSSDIGPQDSWRIDDLGEFGVGYTVVASDRQTTRVHVVRPVTVGEIDTEFDTVSGTTTLQLDDRLQVQADHCSRDDVPATAGSYTADFSVPGAQPHEQNTCDLDPGSSGQVQHFDDDGDFTILWWNLPEHRQIEVYPEFDLVGGWDAELTLTVERGGNKVYPDGPGPATGYNGFALWEDGFDLLPGDLVTVSDGETTKDHLVRSHTITSLTEAPGNTVAGTALPGTTLFIRHNTIESQLSDDNIESATIVVDGTGNWDYPFTNDVGPGTAVEVIEFDLPNSDNDQTFVVAYIPNPPTFMASLDDGSFFGDGWPVGDVVTISVDDPATTEPVDYTVDPYPTEQRGFPWDTHFNTDGGWDLQPGYVVTVTTDPDGDGDGDGTPDLEKTLTVVDLTLEGIDPEAAVVTGRAEPGATVYVFAQNEWEFAWRNVVAEPAGSGDPGFWMADLSMLGPDDDGDGTVGLPLAPNTGFAAQVFDIDGDATNYGGCFECEGGGHPWLAVILGPYGAGISGEQFGTDGPFTITLDDPATPDDGPDHTWVVPDDFPEGGALVGDGFWLYGPFQDGSVQLTPGHVVTVTDMSNDTYREHTIRDLSYDDVDLTTNTVSGWSGSPEMVNVSIGNPEQWRTPQVNASDTPNANGNWTVDFSSFTNVLPLIGLEGLISIPDDDDTPGDQTGILWGPPFIAAGIDVDGPDPRVIDAVWGGFWLHDDTVEMKVFDPDDLTQPKFGPVQGTVDKSWFNGFQLEQQPTELEVGDVVHVRGLQSGDELTHTVLDLQVDGWEWAAVDEEGNHLLDENGDPIGNRVWGTAQPTGHTGIIKLRIDDDLGMRMVDVALDGTWVVDFNLPPDEEGEWGDEVRLGPGMGGSVHLRGDDGNLAWAPWGEHGGGEGPGELHLHAMAYGNEWLSGEGLPSGMYVIQIEGAGECSNLVYRQGSEFHVDAAELCDDGDLKPDHHVVVSAVAEDGVSPGQLIAEFAIDGVVISGADVDTDTVWGLATDGKPVTVALFDESTEEPVAWRTVDLADGESEWSVDFSTAPDPQTEDNWGDGVLAGRSVWAAQFDAQGHTESDWVDVEPHIYVNRITDAIVLENWPTGGPITLEVFASETVGALPLYVDSMPAPGPYYVFSNHTELDEFDLLAGQYVVVTAGAVEVAHSVAAIGVESFDFVEDSYDGIATAEPGSTVRTGVWYEHDGRQEGSVEFPATPEWTADFTEQGLDFSATDRIEGYVAEFDLGGNATFYEFAAKYEVLTPNDDGTATSSNGEVTVEGLDGSDNITMTETDSSDVGDGFQTVGTSVDVDGTDADGDPIVRDFEAGDEPLILILRILGDDMPEGLALEDILVFRNGVDVPSCPDVLQSNSDFPCVSTREWVDGDVVLTVQTLAFSTWTMAFRLVEITGFSATAQPIAVGSPVDASGSFDVGATDFTAVIHWDDGSCRVIDVDNAAFHVYTDPGVYTPVLEVYAGSRTCADVADEDPIDSATHRYVVVYDPDGGFVTGGGWIDSPAGAYTLDPELTGRANFGFVAKYKKGKITPDGNTDFQFQTAGLHFQSTAYDWLVITGGEKAKYKGVGTINGEGSYGFMLTAIDGDDGDTFRIKIWAEATDNTVYDNWLGAGDDSYDGTTLGGGSIVVHTAENK